MLYANKALVLCFLLYQSKYFTLDCWVTCVRLIVLTEYFSDWLLIDYAFNYQLLLLLFASINNCHVLLYLYYILLLIFIIHTYFKKYFFLIWDNTGFALAHAKVSNILLLQYIKLYILLILFMRFFVDMLLSLIIEENYCF